MILKNIRPTKRLIRQKKQGSRSKSTALQTLNLKTKTERTSAFGCGTGPDPHLQMNWITAKINYYLNKQKSRYLISRDFFHFACLR